MSITIKDISKKLGISVSTVSKALNGYPDVSEVTRERILEMARQLDYHPNTAAQSLRRRHTNKIGLLMTYSVASVSEFLSQLVIGAALAAEKEGFNLVLYTSITNQLDQITRICRAREVDGLLVTWATQVEKTIALLERESIPFVSIARRVANYNVSCVVADNKQGALMLTRHLISQGHRRIGFTPMPNLRETNLDRLAGYQQALSEANIPFDENLLSSPISPTTGTRHGAINDLLNVPDPPTAIFAFNDYVAIEALQVVADRGLRVPEDLAIVGFDGTYTSQVTNPPITTVLQPVQDIGRRAAELLLAHITDNNQPPHQIILPVELIPRQSTLGVD